MPPRKSEQRLGFGRNSGLDAAVFPPRLVVLGFWPSWFM